MEQSDCKACHQQKEASIGPNYEAIAAKYAGDAGAKDYLANKIIKGGGGKNPVTAKRQVVGENNGEEEDMKKRKNTKMVVTRFTTLTRLAPRRRTAYGSGSSSSRS